jgi:hypothetical protein
LVVGEPVVALTVALGIPPAETKFINGILSPYAYFTGPAPNTVKVAEAVLKIVNEYASLEDAFPAAGAVPPE